MSHYIYSDFVHCEGAEIFTVVCLPHKGGKFPTVLYRSPYVDDEEALTEREICEKREAQFAYYLDAGYAVVHQHCRGRGKSTGDCVPYIYEREDGLALQAWVREQPFYNGELYLRGSSYTTSVHFVTAPFAPDIKGAILEVSDCERYNLNYRNGIYKSGLHGGWYVGMYKKKSIPRKNYTKESYKTLPLSEFSHTVFGERAPDFDEILRHPKREDPFWSTRFGGGEAHESIRRAGIPILLVTGAYDIFTGGVFDMWRTMEESTRAMSALAVHPLDHSGTGKDEPIQFENGVLKEAFPNYTVRWLDAVRGKCDYPFALGKITYYALFENKWRCDDFYDAERTQRIPLGEGRVTYTYNPYNPASFQGGLSTNFGGTAWQDPPNSRYDIVSVFTPVFEEDTLIKGKMRARLKVASDCEDTCFYLRLSLCREEGDYGLRDDINQISNFDAAYRPNGELFMDFSFDEHVFLVKKGERLRVDISSSAFHHYVPHTNTRGLFSEQTSAKIARNTVVLEESYIELPIKE